MLKTSGPRCRTASSVFSSSSWVGCSLDCDSVDCVWMATPPFVLIETRHGASSLGEKTQIGERGAVLLRRGARLELAAARFSSEASLRSIEIPFRLRCSLGRDPRSCCEALRTYLVAFTACREVRWFEGNTLCPGAPDLPSDLLSRFWPR